MTDKNKTKSNNTFSCSAICLVEPKYLVINKDICSSLSSDVCSSECKMKHFDISNGHTYGFSINI